MLRFDRYLVARSGAIDLATGSVVDFHDAPDGRTPAALFQRRQGRTLIDYEANTVRRTEVWERWTSGAPPSRLAVIVADFTEMLECARLGAPRAFDLSVRQAQQHDYLCRVLAREARMGGWVPIHLELLGAVARSRLKKLPEWLADRSLVIFASIPGLSGDAVLALLELSQRDARPHILVRTLTDSAKVRAWSRGPGFSTSIMVHERLDSVGAISIAASDRADLRDEAKARWAVLIREVTGGNASASRERQRAERSRPVLQLARVLVDRGQAFEARALVTGIPPDQPGIAADVMKVSSAMEARGRARALASLGGPHRAGVDPAMGWEMVDDFVGVLQMCQDIEDEQTTLARVGAFLRERLQASTVAFVARDAPAPRVLARVGSEIAGIDLAVRAIDTGISIAPARGQGPAECACPVRHATEVIGAVWCRWSAGMPIAIQQASTLLGVVAAATAPSVRLAIAKVQPAPSRQNPVPELVGDSPAMVAVRNAIVRAAASPFPVVIEGESGSGKELAARAIHARSARRGRRFCAVNCAALVDDLADTELFGHVRGAFTGAITDRMGVFEDASGGTLFLDEVVELGTRVQAKLLRTLQEGEIRRIGETMVRKVDVRVVAATNRPLAKAVAAGAFRTDLWYRLDVVRITLPPLRERLEDLPSLVSHIWQGLVARAGSRATLSGATVAGLATYDWPGNIRELQNVLASMLVATARSGVIGRSALPSHIVRAAAMERGATLADARRQFEERYVRAALARAGGSTTTAARDLGLSRQGLTKVMERLGIGATSGEALTRANVQ